MLHWVQASKMLHVITHVNSNRNIDRTRCLGSIQANLTTQVRHHMIPLRCNTHQEFLVERYRALSLGDLVCFVDDDDFLESSSVFQLIIDAFNTFPNIGCVYTDEYRYHSQSTIIHSKSGSTYESVFDSAQRIHHLVAYRSACVNKESLNIALKAGCGLEWAMTAQSMLTHGAVYIPIPAYNWVLHSQQITNLVNHNFKNIKPLFHDQFKQWQRNFGNVVVYTHKNS